MSRNKRFKRHTTEPCGRGEFGPASDSGEDLSVLVTSAGVVQKRKNGRANRAFDDYEMLFTLPLGRLVIMSLTLVTPGIESHSSSMFLWAPIPLGYIISYRA